MILVDTSVWIDHLLATVSIAAPARLFDDVATITWQAGCSADRPILVLPHTHGSTEENMSTRLTSKGQVTIPKPVREHLGLGPGDAVEFEFADEAAYVCVGRASLHR